MMGAIMMQSKDKKRRNGSDLELVHVHFYIMAGGSALSMRFNMSRPNAEPVSEGSEISNGKHATSALSTGGMCSRLSFTARCTAATAA